MLFKTDACLLRQRFNKREVVLSRSDRHVPHVGLEDRKFCLDVDVGPVPTQQRVNGESMAIVLDSGQATIRLADPQLPQEFLDDQGETCDRIASSTRSAVPYEWHIRGEGNSLASKTMKETVKGISAV